MKQTRQFTDRAAYHFNTQGFNCAQSVLLTMQEYYGTSENRLIPKIATPFGAGIGRRGSLCGALTGATIAIGLRHGTNTTSLQRKEKAYNLALKLYDQFVKEFGSPYCRELTGYDLNDPRDREKMHKSKTREQKCSSYVQKAVQILIGLETEPNRHKP